MNDKHCNPILVFGLNPSKQKCLLIDNFRKGGVNRASEQRLAVGGKGNN
jgi:fructose-1-phosphate kinase PfkB-like protein